MQVCPRLSTFQPRQGALELCLRFLSLASPRVLITDSLEAIGTKDTPQILKHRVSCAIVGVLEHAHLVRQRQKGLRYIGILACAFTLQTRDDQIDSCNPSLLSSDSAVHHRLT